MRLSENVKRIQVWAWPVRTQAWETFFASQLADTLANGRVRLLRERALAQALGTSA